MFKYVISTGASVWMYNRIVFGRSSIRGNKKKIETKWKRKKLKINKSSRGWLIRAYGRTDLTWRELIFYAFCY